MMDIRIMGAPYADALHAEIDAALRDMSGRKMMLGDDRDSRLPPPADVVTPLRLEQRLKGIVANHVWRAGLTHEQVASAHKQIERMAEQLRGELEARLYPRNAYIGSMPDFARPRAVESPPFQATTMEELEAEVSERIRHAPPDSIAARTIEEQLVARLLRIPAADNEATRLARVIAHIHVGDGDELGVVARRLLALIGFEPQMTDEEIDALKPCAVCGAPAGTFGFAPTLCGHPPR